MSTNPILIILPTFNEAGAIGEVISRIDELSEDLSLFEIDILHIDDSSTDATAEIARAVNFPHFHQVIRPGKLGLGTAYLYGFQWALDSKKCYQLIVEMDGDGSHLAEDLPDLLAPFGNATPPDLVLGTRWMPGGRVSHWPLYRRLISRIGTKYAQIALQLPLRDLTSGYRVFSREAIKTLLATNLSSKGYSFQIETAMRIVDSGLIVFEVPIHFVERTVGKSKMSIAIAIEAWRKVTIWGTQRLLSNRR